MIQRIQSVYLMLVFLLACLMMFANPRFAAFKYQKSDKLSSEIRFVSNTFYNSGDPGVSTSKLLNVLIIAATGVLAVGAIFMYKNTSLQKKFTLYTVILSVVLLVILFFDYNSIGGQRNDISSYPGLHMIWPIASIVLGVLAWINIRRDENLVNSMDRIR